MIVQSCEYPETIRIDIIKNGAARLLCRWDVREIEVKIDDETHTEYEYQEEVIWWALPLPGYIERVNGRQVITEAGRQYIADNTNDILDWAMTAAV